MLVKTKEFVEKLNSKLYQYTFNKKIPLSLKGSFRDTTYISDIDFSAYVYFNDKFIQILIHKLNNLKDFKFLYLNAGIDKDMKTPWVIYPKSGCDFDIDKARKWFSEFKTKKIIPNDSYTKIEQILNKKKLILGDIVEIQEILKEYNRIRWFLPDIINGTKTIRGHTYTLLEELKRDTGPVINTIYIDGKDIVSVDIGLVDKKHGHPIWETMYKYYTTNWYKILKSYKFFISKDHETEYKKTMSSLEYENAVLAKSKLLNSLMKYNPVGKNSINYIAQDLRKNLEKEGIITTSLKEVVDILAKRLNNKSKPYVDYFLDKLNDVGKIKNYQLLRLTEVAKIPTSIDQLIKRRQEGIECPFFESDTDQNINNLADRLLLDPKKWYKCLVKVSKREGKNLDVFVKEIFDKSPVSRLFLQHRNKLYIRGAISNKDDKVFEKIGENKRDYYTFDLKYMKRLQIYLITGY